MINCAASPADWSTILSQTDRFPDELIPAIGIHPWFTQNLPPAWPENLADLLQCHPALCIGEAGLDALREGGLSDIARGVFRQQIALAIDFKRPLIIHCVRAWAPLLEILKSFGTLPAGFMLHAFAGTPELIRELLPLGAYFSFGGAITRPDNHRVHRALRETPPDRLLIETDSPDFLPDSISDRDQPNEPANLPLILQSVATLRGTSPESIAALTAANATRFLASIQSGATQTPRNRTT